MDKKQNPANYFGQFGRDFLVMSGVFATVLGALWIAGFMDGQGFAIGLAAGGIAAFLYSLARRFFGVARAAKDSHEAPQVRQAGEGALRSKLSVVRALNQPALMVVSGIIKGRNLAADTVFKLPLGRPDLSVASLRDPTLLSAIDRVQREGGHIACELQPAGRQDEFWHVDITALGAEPEEDGLLLVLTDLKPVRLAERARADFLANASHELRTPLTSIGGFIETMKGPAKDDKDSWPRFIAIMDEQTRHMRDLIADLLSLSRIELSEHVLPETEIDLGLLAEEAVEALGHVVEKRGIAIKVEKPARSLYILGDASEVKQVIGNLLSNAMKYAPDNSNIELALGWSETAADAQQQAARTWDHAGRVSLRLPQSNSSACVWLRVRDYGPGIPQEHLTRLGERFYRVDGSRGGPIEGTGLGLAIVKHIMGRHRGGFAVESIFGEGASFSVWFAQADSIS